ncbi:MAG: hypothetical protein WD038_00080 [Balneolales bacterium]
MGIIGEPKGVDLIVKSEPWSDEELRDFRKLMREKKAKLDPKVKAEIKKYSRKISELQS